MTLGDILKQYRTDNNISMDEFVKKSSLSKGYISMLENNINPRNNKPIAPTLPTIRKVAVGMNMDVDTLLRKIDDNQEISLQDDTIISNSKKYCAKLELNSDEMEHIEKYRSLDPHGRETVSYILDRECERVTSLQNQKKRINELEAESAPMRIIAYYQRLASAGSGDYLFDDIPTEFIKVKDSPLSRQADFVIGVNGNSMEDTYFDGDKVFVKKLPEISIGDIGLFTKGNDCYIKELGADRLISHNKDKKTYPDIPSSEDIQLVGKVLGKVEES